MSALSTFIKTYNTRRTQYQLKKALPQGVTIEQVQSIVQEFVKHTPTSFNMQSLRAVVITGALHEAVWKAVADALPTDDAKRRPLSAKDEAYGSVIFFDDSTTIKGMQEKFAVYADYFPIFAATSNGAAQINTWAAIGELGLGGHLQHYNPFVEAALKGKVPESWTVQAQLVFGVPTAEAGPKQFIENEVKVLSE
ncbi:CYFA0S14e00584g1_1 [Cyberlindnera fabianii]|uniref:CYFA0S14e00584g1_1 n=1 Tax=Cyberlindnera fabianii TaxID=36022 RepID=A0A061B2M5_CYBFA|nr:putative nitroreductase HBN1 [Cyberlindnera fabianii]CDR44184.1 CYFA0S14e00584g1_1 [Cyberlindnera fabianii]